jgi:hypothetical protein
MVWKPRKFKRYSLVGRLGLKASISKIGEIRLVTISQGGCGFFAEKHLFSYDGDPVECQFEWPLILSEEILVAGKLRYSVSVKYSPHEDMRYFGIEFPVSEHQKVEPLIAALETIENMMLELDGRSSVLSSDPENEDPF